MSLARLFATDAGTRNLALRVILAATIFPHGAQKLLGWFGGYGFSGTMGYFTSLGIPSVLGFLVIMAESIGALLLAAGLFTRVAAAGIGATMLGAIALVHAENGFFMNWFGVMPAGKEGFEAFLPLVALAAVLVVEGAGRASVDAYLARRLAGGRGATSSRDADGSSRTEPAHAVR